MYVGDDHMILNHDPPDDDSMYLGDDHQTTGNYEPKSCDSKRLPQMILYSLLHMLKTCHIDRCKPVLTDVKEYVE